MVNLPPAELRLLRCLLIAFSIRPVRDKRALSETVQSYFTAGCRAELIRPAVATLSADEWRNAEAELAKAEERGIEVVAYFEPEFPAALREIEIVPLVLFIRGKFPQGERCAIVGSRRASTFGRNFASTLARALSSHGIPVVSGFALGIDSAAHRGAIDGKYAPGIAVLGSGVCTIYPEQNVELADELLAAGGSIISEFGLDTAPRSIFFPQRNRIITALAKVVLVIEAQERSGALITARLAAEQGKEVFAVPGSIANPLAKGTNWLIKSGAQLLTGIDDLLSAFPQLRDEAALAPAGTKRSQASGANAQVLKLLRADEEKGFDALVEESGLAASALGRILAELELEGRIESLPGGLFVKR